MVITRAQSDKNWIYFKSSNNIRSTALRTPSGDIELRVENEEEIRKEEIKKPLTIKDYFVFFYGLLLWLGMPLIKGYFLVPKIKANVIDVKLYLLPVIIYTILQLINTIFFITKKGIVFRKNHGAEHKVFNAYNVLKRVPSIKEAQEFSRICKTCGGTIASALITGQIIGFVVYVKSGVVISEKLLFIIPIFLHGFFPFNLIGKLFQFLTTAKPDDSNIDLAIAALDALDEKENSKLTREEAIELANLYFDSSNHNSNIF